jgi:glycosyltransferase involved in cell wall biosynthesis
MNKEVIQRIIIENQNVVNKSMKILKMNIEPLVSICCLTYNHEAYIRQCLEGFVMQKTNFQFEVLIHDDASTDSTADIILEYVSKYPNIIKPIYQTENQYLKGINVSAEYQYLRAKGKYIALCEGDDYWTDPYKLQKQVDFLEANPNYAMVHTRYLIYVEKTKSFEQVAPVEKSGDIFYELLASNQIATLSVLMRKDCLIEAINANILNLNFLTGDYPLWLFFAQRYKIGYLSDCTAVYRLLEESLSHTNDPVRKYQFAQSVFDVRYFFGKETEYRSILQKEINDYNFSRILYAFRNNRKDLGKLVYASLKKYHILSMKYLLYYWGTQNKLVEIVLRTALFLKRKLKND